MRSLRRYRKLNSKANTNIWGRMWICSNSSRLIFQHWLLLDMQKRTYCNEICDNICYLYILSDIYLSSWQDGSPSQCFVIVLYIIVCSLLLGHCIVCPWFTASDCPVGVFKLFLSWFKNLHPCLVKFERTINSHLNSLSTKIQ